MCITNTWILLIHMFYEISIIWFISFVNFGYLLIFCWKIRSYYKFPYPCENIWCLFICFVLWITLIIFSCIYFRNHPTDSNKDGAYLVAKKGWCLSIRNRFFLKQIDKLILHSFCYFPLFTASLYKPTLSNSVPYASPIPAVSFLPSSLPPPP